MNTLGNVSEYAISEHATKRLKLRFGLTDSESKKWMRRQLSEGEIKGNGAGGRLIVQNGPIILIVDPEKKLLITAYPVAFYGGGSDELLDVAKDKFLLNFIQRPLQDYLAIRKQQFIPELGSAILDLEDSYRRFQHGDDNALADLLKQTSDLEEQLLQYQAITDTPTKLINQADQTEVAPAITATTSNNVLKFQLPD